MMLSKITRAAINGMVFMIYRGAWTGIPEDYKEDLIFFAGQVDFDQDSKEIAFIEEVMLSELDAQEYLNEGPEKFLELLAEFLGDESKETMFYKMTYKVVHEIKKIREED